jgi:ribonuclease-3
MSEPTSPEQQPPAPAAPEPVAALQARLAVALRDHATALTALTHKSFVNEHRGEPQSDNERLEFLGDAVIDLAVSHRLMERFPGAREGDLSKMRAAVVDEQGLASMAREIGLGELLRLGRGEELTGGRHKASLLADAMEAVVAAVYLESGLDGVLALVDRFLDEAFARAAAGTLDRDYKTQLQELAQSRLRVTPRYRVVAELGPDHAKVFEVELDLRGEVLGRAQGRSKKDAEQAAAKLALEVLGRRFAAEAPPAEPPPGAEVVEAPAEPPAASVEPVPSEVEPVAEAPPAPRRKPAARRAPRARRATAAKPAPRKAGRASKLPKPRRRRASTR